MYSALLLLPRNEEGERCHPSGSPPLPLIKHLLRPKMRDIAVHEPENGKAIKIDENKSLFLPLSCTRYLYVVVGHHGWTLRKEQGEAREEKKRKTERKKVAS